MLYPVMFYTDIPQMEVTTRWVERTIEDTGP